MVSSEEIILTRISVMQKVHTILNSCIPHIDGIIMSAIPEQVKDQLVVPKISKGEHYLQMPYMLLDCPRIFSGKDIFAVRTMFMWANFFSVTLHLSGNYLQTFKNKMLKAQYILPVSWYVCISNDQWQHHFESNNYIALHSMENWESFVQEATFIKLAVKFNLDKWEKMTDLLNESYQQTASLLH